MSPRCHLFAPAMALVVCLAPAARAADGDWEHTFVIYAMGAALDGKAQFGDLVVPVDLSISDLLDALEFGAMGAYRADNGTWSITVDATYMGLGGDAATRNNIVKGDLEVDQYTLMVTGGRRITPSLEALFSLAYFDLSSDLAIRIRNPLTQEDSTRNVSESAGWVDPLIGLQWNVPIGENWRANLRGDIGGFGVGSDFSYQVLANLRWQINDRFGVIFGYRIIGFDYKDGSGSDYERYDLTEQGPLVGLTMTF